MAASLARRKTSCGSCPFASRRPSSTIPWERTPSTSTWISTLWRTDYDQASLSDSPSAAHIISADLNLIITPIIATPESWKDSDESYAPPRWVPQLHAACHMRALLCATAEASWAQTAARSGSSRTKASKMSDELVWLSDSPQNWSPICTVISQCNIKHFGPYWPARLKALVAPAVLRLFILVNFGQCRFRPFPSFRAEICSRDLKDFSPLENPAPLSLMQSPTP